MKSIKLCGLGLVLASMTLLIASCGGSGGDAPASSAASTTITGSVFAAPVAGAAVVVLNSSGTTTIAGPVTTADDGTYSVNIPTAALASDLIISSSTGTFADEATSAQTPAGTMAAYVEAGTLTAGSKVALDPSSTIVCDLVTRFSKTFGEAKNIFAAAFGYTPDTSIVPKNAPTSGSDAPQRLAGLRAMAFSRLTKDLGLTPGEQFDLLAAIADDLVDGTLDGNDGLISLGTGTLPEDIGNRFEQSLITMLTNTAVNLTGLTTAEIGALPFGKIALTNSYKVEYLPGMMPATQGKTSFKIRISNRIGGSPATDLSLSLMPKMHMATMSHMTPVDGTITENLPGTPGTYSCTVYYLMASGMGMGYWELKVQIGGETATFYPSVGMAMGSNTVRTTLKGQSDIISSMTGTENRSYYLFRDGLSGTTDNHTFNLFIAAKESMMSYPALSTLAPTTLHDQGGTPWAVSTVNVLASTNGSTWSSPALETTTGHWSFSGLTGLVSGQTGTIYVKLTVNGVDKTTDGNAVSGINGYATFTVVTP